MAHDLEARLAIRNLRQEVHQRDATNDERHEATQLQIQLLQYTPQENQNANKSRFNFLRSKVNSIITLVNDAYKIAVKAIYALLHIGGVNWVSADRVTLDPTTYNSENSGELRDSLTYIP